VWPLHFLLFIRFYRHVLGAGRCIFDETVYRSFYDHFEYHMADDVANRRPPSSRLRRRTWQTLSGKIDKFSEKCGNYYIKPLKLTVLNVIGNNCWSGLTGRKIITGD
jgi:hypothetical protein